LNGGVQVEGKAVSAKMCTEDDDEMLSTMGLADLAMWHEINNVPNTLPLVVKLAYPYAGEMYKEMEESPYFNMSLEELQENEKIDSNMKQRLMILKEARSKGDVHLVYDYEDYHANKKYVIYGDSTHNIWPYRSNCVSGCYPDPGA
jgi:hypothetical protein